MEQNIIDVLLDLGPREMRTQKIKMRDMSARAGQPIVFEVRELSYAEIRDIDRMEGGGSDGDVATAVVIAGVTSPDLRNPALLERYGEPSLARLLPKMLSAGEIAELAMRIEQLSGYRRTVTEIVEDIQKN